MGKSTKANLSLAAKQDRIASEAHYRVLRALEANPELSQRQLSIDLGISLGKANYCLKALIDKGWIKTRNFRNSENKRGYAYILTPKGITGKAKMTGRFLKSKLAEYEQLRTEIAELKSVLDNDD